MKKPNLSTHKLFVPEIEKPCPKQHILRLIKENTNLLENEIEVVQTGDGESNFEIWVEKTKIRAATLQDILDEKHAKQKLQESEAQKRKDAVKKRNDEMEEEYQKHVDLVTSKDFERIAKMDSYMIFLIIGVMMFLISLYNHWGIGITVGLVLSIWAGEEVLQIKSLKKAYEL